MNKKLWLTTLASPIAVLPVLTTVACQTSATDNETQNQIGNIGNSELSRFTFLLFKSNVISLVNRDQIKDSEELKKHIIDEIKKFPTIRESSINVTTENENFIIEYQLKVVAGTIKDSVGIKDPSLIKETKSLNGNFKIPLPKGN